jgi:hypothetical protein
VEDQEAMTIYEDCVSSENLVCKHWRSTSAFYVDLDNRIPTGVTIISVAADTTAEDLIVAVAEIITVDTEVRSGCGTNTLFANRAIKIALSGGVPSEDEVTVTVVATLSDSQEESVDCRLIVGGAESGASS